MYENSLVITERVIQPHCPLLAKPGSLKTMMYSCCFHSLVPSLRHFNRITFKQSISFNLSLSTLNTFKKQESRVFMTIKPS